jgi:hypothetical protein
MIPLLAKTNVSPADADYPYGNIKNNGGSGDGTPVDKSVYADFHQFFERMFALSGIIPNGLPDNATDDFQLYEALIKVTSADKTLINANFGTLTNAATGFFQFKGGFDLVDTKGEYNSTTGDVTISRSGWYRLESSINATKISGSLAGLSLTFKIGTGSPAASFVSAPPSTPNSCVLSGSKIFLLTAGDVLKFGVLQQDTDSTDYIGGFNVELLKLNI